MTTEIQIEANRKNSQLGGVKTEQGKTISRRNATKHGFFSEIITEHDKIHAKEFCDAMYEDLQPANEHESQLVEIILASMLSFRRICIIESRLVSAGLNNVLGEDNFLESLQSKYRVKFEHHPTDELLKILDYKKSALGLITKTQHELERLQRMRAGEQIPSPAICDINITTK